MKLFIVLVAAFVCGCAGRFDTVPANAFPDHLTRAQADSLYQSHALHCEGGDCARADGTRPVRAYSENGYDAANDALKSRRRARLVGGLVPGATGAGAFLVGVAFLGMASQAEQQAVDVAEFGIDGSSNLEKASTYRTVATGMFIGGGVLAATGLILGLALPNGHEDFEEEYNRSLREDLDRRAQASELVVLPPRRDTWPK